MVEFFFFVRSSPMQFPRLPWMPWNHNHELTQVLIGMKAEAWQREGAMLKHWSGKGLFPALFFISEWLPNAITYASIPPQGCGSYLSCTITGGSQQSALTCLMCPAWGHGSHKGQSMTVMIKTRFWKHSSFFLAWGSPHSTGGALNFNYTMVPLLFT